MFPRHRGLTLLELVVVISIVVVIASIWLPALHHARENATVVRCSSNARELGLAVMHFETIHKQLPSNGGFQIGDTILGADGAQHEIFTHDLSKNQTDRWGIGSPTSNAINQSGSWGYAVLPHVDQAIAYQQLQTDFDATLFHCPTRTIRGLAPPQDDQFGRYGAAGLAWSRTDYAGNLNVIGARKRPSFISPYENHFGMDAVILLGEKAIAPQIQTSSSWYFDEPIMSGGSLGTARGGTSLSRDSASADFRNSFGSPHRRTVVFCYLSGRVQPIAFEIDQQVLRDSISPKISKITQR